MVRDFGQVIRYLRRKWLVLTSEDLYFLTHEHDREFVGAFLDMAKKTHAGVLIVTSLDRSGLQIDLRNAIAYEKRCYVIKGVEP